ncbi:type III secretion system cytoplasmic ring protein SctQ [Paraburkholderia agricolaris]|uniref:type III secretion system cytoplasmic ring protein SctQ n=1 Tax=Paraburkholderia agricolaris TaxID=2152888 RepID=UPI0038BE1B5A
MNNDLPRPPHPHRYAPPRLRRDEAIAQTAIAQHGRHIALPGEDNHVASLSPLPHGSAREPSRAPPLLSMAWSGGRFDLFGDPGIVDAIVLGQFGASAATQAPHTLRAVAFEYWLHELLERHGLSVRGAPQFLELSQASLPFRYRWRIQHAASTHPTEAAGELHCNATGHFLLASLLGRRPVKTTIAFANALPLQQRLGVGCCRVASGTLRSLRRHDVLVVQDQHWRSGELQVRASPTLAWCARLEKSTLIVTRGLYSIMNPSTDDFPADMPEHAHTSVSDGTTDSHGNPAAVIADSDAISAHGAPQALAPAVADMREPVAEALEQVPVMLHFDLGHCDMTLAQLRALAPGSVLELGRAPGRAVAIRTNGLLVGHGELVEIDGLLGVAVTDLRWPGEER